MPHEPHGDDLRSGLTGLEVVQSILACAEVMYGQNSPQVKALLRAIGTSDLSTAAAFRELTSLLKNKDLFPGFKTGNSLLHRVTFPFQYEPTAIPAYKSYEATLLRNGRIVEAGQASICTMIGKGIFTPYRILAVHSKYPRADVELTETGQQMQVRDVIPCLNCGNHWNFKFQLSQVIA